MQIRWANFLRSPPAAATTRDALAPSLWCLIFWLKFCIKLSAIKWMETTSLNAPVPIEWFLKLENFLHILRVRSGPCWLTSVQSTPDSVFKSIKIPHWEIQNTYRPGWLLDVVSSVACWFSEFSHHFYAYATPQNTIGTLSRGAWAEPERFGFPESRGR